MSRRAPFALALVSALCGCAGERAPAVERLAAEDEAFRQQCPGRDKVRGIDVSYYQPRVDWPVARAGGVAFAFARVADGSTVVDPSFGDHWAGMKAAGVIRGAYQYFRPAEDPNVQAAVFLREIQAQGGLRAGDLPPALDLEVDGGLSRDAVRARTQAWLAHVEAALGRTPIVYTSPGFWEQIGADAGAGASAFGRYPLWVAHWDVACPSLPGAWERWRFWQDGTDRTAPGVAAPVDTSWFDGSRADLLAFAGADRPRGMAPRPAPRARSRPRRRAPRPLDLAALLRILPM
jgi:lysozyme